MKPSLRAFLERSQEQIKRIKDNIQKLKEERDDEIDDELPHAPIEKHDRKETEIIFSMWNVAQATIVVLSIVALGQFIHEIGNILMILFVSILFAAALDPTIDHLRHRYKIPRAFSILAMFAALIAVLVFFVSQLIPLLASQLLELARNTNHLISTLSTGDYPLSTWLNPILEPITSQLNDGSILESIKASLNDAGQQLQQVAGDTLSVLINAFSGILNFLLILMLTFLLTVDEKSVDSFFVSLFPTRHGSYVIEKMELIKKRVGHWLRGQIALMFAMFGLSWIGYLILGVDYALTLAMFVGLAELVPVIGPISSAIPALLVAFNESHWLAVWTLVFMVLLQQMENNIVVPLIMRKAVGLSPVVIILAMLIGFKTLGVLGAIIAIPVTTTLSIFVNDYTSKKK